MVSLKILELSFVFTLGFLYRVLTFALISLRFLFCEVLNREILRKLIRNIGN